MHEVTHSMNTREEEEILKVAEEISKIVPSFCGVTLGGSRSHEHDDALSDVEMYFYSQTDIPVLEDINTCMNNLRAKHKRCDSYLWNMYPWGPHTFFVVNDLYFEVGYRVLRETQDKINAYLLGNVQATSDCHDLGLGYVYSGLAFSVCAEKILMQTGNELDILKENAKKFPPELKKALKIEYLDTAESLLYGKMKSAVERGDVFLYDILASRVIRSLMVMAFACSCTHFPGDKWNEILLMETDWNEKKYFVELIKKHAAYNSFVRDELKKKYNVLIIAYLLVLGDCRWEKDY